MFCQDFNGIEIPTNDAGDRGGGLNTVEDFQGFEGVHPDVNPGGEKSPNFKGIEDPTSEGNLIRFDCLKLAFSVFRPSTQNTTQSSICQRT